MNATGVFACRGVLAGTSRPVVLGASRSRQPQVRSVALHSRFHGAKLQPGAGARATLRGGLINLNRSARIQQKTRQAKVVTQASLGSLASGIWQKVVGLELEAVAFEEHFAAVVQDVCNKAVHSWYLHGGLAFDAMVVWGLKKALLWAVVIFAVKNLSTWLHWIVHRFHLNRPSPKKVQDSISSQVVMAAEKPLKRAMIGGVILSTVHPAPIHLGVRINHAIGRPGCLIGELKIPQVLYISCCVWYVLLAKNAIINHLKKEANDKHKIELIDQILTILIVVVGVLAVGEVTNLPLSSMAALVGGSGFAIAWASQQLLGNFLAALVLRLAQPYSINEAVNINGTAGFIQDVGLFATKILTFDQIIVDIPNSQILGTKIINLSRSPFRNCHIVFGVRPEDLQKCKKISQEVVAMMMQHPKVERIAAGPTSPRCSVTEVTPDGMAVKLEVNCMMPNAGGPETTAAYKADLIFLIGDIVKANGAHLMFRKYDATVNMLG